MTGYRTRCRHEVTRDLLESLIEHDYGRGVTPSKLRLGKTGGSLNYDRLNPWLEKLEAAGFIEVRPGESKSSRLCKMLPKGRLWLSRFNQLEKMIEGR